MRVWLHLHLRLDDDVAAITRELAQQNEEGPGVFQPGDAPQLLALHGPDGTVPGVAQHETIAHTALRHPGPHSGGGERGTGSLSGAPLGERSHHGR